MNNDLISREALKEHKFVGNKFVQIGGRTNGKTLESINKAYQQGWNDAIDAIIDNAPPIVTIAEITPDKIMFTTEMSAEKGEWIMNKTSPRGRNYTCTKCGKVSRNKFDFCPNCGVKMQKGGAE